MEQEKENSTSRQYLAPICMIVLSMPIIILPVNPNSFGQQLSSVISPIDISQYNTAPDNPKMAVAENGNVYTVWEETDNMRVLFSRSTDGGVTFSEPIALSGEEQAENPEVAAEGDNIYVAWGSTGELHFSRSTDGGVTFGEENVWGNYTSNDISRAQLATFGNDTVYILLFSDDNRDQRILLAQSTDDGATFSEPTTITTNATLDPFQRPQMALTENGIIYVSWFEGDKILLKKSDPGKIIFSDTPRSLFDGYSCTSDVQISTSQNNIYAICKFENEETPEGRIPGTHIYLHYKVLLYTESTDGGATFSDTVSLTDKANSFVDTSFIASNDNSGYIAYSDYNEGDSNQAAYLMRISGNQNRFDRPIRISNENPGFDSIISDLKVVGGNIYIPWYSRSATDGLAPLELFFSGSNDGGNSFIHPLPVGKSLQRIPQLKVAPSDENVHFVWMGGDDSMDAVIQYAKLSSFPTSPFDTLANTAESRNAESGNATARNSGEGTPEAGLEDTISTASSSNDNILSAVANNEESNERVIVRIPQGSLELTYATPDGQFYYAILARAATHLTYVACTQKNLVNFAMNECTSPTPPIAQIPTAPECQTAASSPSNPNIPLDPGNGGRSIDTSALQIGDIILSTTDHIPSKLIRFATNSPVSHSMLYVGGGQVVEAVGGGVRVVSIETAVADSNLAVALRYPGLTQEQALKIRDYAGQQLGKRYDYRYGVVGQALFRLDLLCGFPLEQAGRVNLGTGTNDRWFCSELVIASYAAAGVPLTTTPPSWTSPGDIIPLILNGKLQYVGHLKTP